MCEPKSEGVGAFHRFRDDRVATQGILDAATLERGSMVLSGWLASLDIGSVGGFKVACGGKAFTKF